ncbi:MAG: hypothetical protein J6Z14_14400 [Prevotella sp.]|nr:hypothetical protein [Prevotella sp.]
MRRNIINQQKLVGRPRWLFLMYALLLVPLGVWAEDYNLWVGGIQVTSDNADNVLGDDYVSVSYSEGTLTLKGAQITPEESDAIIIGEDLEALTIRLVGYNVIGANEYYGFSLSGNTVLTFTTSEKLPGSVRSYGDLFNTQQPSVIYQNGLAFNADDNEINAETGLMNIASFTGKVNYVNSDNGGSAYIYTNYFTDFQATVAELKYDSYVLVSTPENSSQTEMWPVSVEASTIEKFTFQFDWGTCTNKSVKVQVVGYGIDEETWDYTADGKTYSSEIALSSADADGIVEIPLLSDVTSEQVRLLFSSTEAFSFVPLNIGITQTEMYPVTIAGIMVTAKNADDVLGDETVSFDKETNTLTLNNAEIIVEQEMAGIKYTGNDDLIISLTGENTIQTTFVEAILFDGWMDPFPSLIFVKGDNHLCSLQLRTGLEEEAGQTVISGFSQINGIDNISDETTGEVTSGNSLMIETSDELFYDRSNGFFVWNEQEAVPVSSVLISTVVATKELNISYGQNSREWATYYDDEMSLETPDGLEAYVVTAASGTGVTVEKIDYIPQGQAVLLKRTIAEVEEPIIALEYMGDETEIGVESAIAWRGTGDETAVGDITTGTVYVLYNDGFTRATTGTISANRGYLLLSEVAAPAGSRLSIIEGVFTDISEMVVPESAETEYYSLSGQRVATPKSGLYIINRKKVIVN